MISAGRFKAKVEDGYPVWVEIFYDNAFIVKISHTQLSDLEYVIKKAMILARQNLGPKQGEV